MSHFVERRKPFSQTALTLALMFLAGVVVAVVFDGVPTWQNHGPNAGAGFVRRGIDPNKYFFLTVVYAGIALVFSFFTFFRFPWITIMHIRLLIVTAFLALLALPLYSLYFVAPMNAELAQAAWKRIEALGGHGVWESDMVVVSLAGTDVTDQDLALFADFPDVQILDLSNTALSDECLQYLSGLNSLESLILINTSISPRGVDHFRSAHPAVDVRTEPSPKNTINPFTGEPTG